MAVLDILLGTRSPRGSGLHDDAQRPPSKARMATIGLAITAIVPIQASDVSDLTFESARQGKPPGMGGSGVL